MRVAAKRDENEPRIIEYLLRVGCKVQQLSDRGIPDLLVSVGPYNLLMEVKMPNGKLTKSQQSFFKKWGNSQVAVVRSINDAKKVVREYMPIRQYKCDNCGTFEKKENYHIEPLKECPECGKMVVQIYSVPQIAFKGSGWAGKKDESKNDA